MADTSIGTPEQLRDPNYTPALHKAVPLGIQHVLAMFVSNVTPAIIIAGAAGFGFGSNSPDFPELLYLIQMSMLFAGIATLFQTIGMGPVGAQPADCAGHQLRLHPDHDPACCRQGRRGASGPFWRRAGRRAVPCCFLATLHRENPFRAATAGDGPCGHDDRPRAGQGRHPVRRGRRPGDRQAGIRQPAELGRHGLGGDLGDTGSEVLHTRHAVGLGCADRHSCRLPRYALALGMVTVEGNRQSWDRAATFALPNPCKYGFEFSVRGHHRLLPDGLRLGGRNRGRCLGHHQGRRGPRGDGHGNPGRDLRRRRGQLRLQASLVVSQTPRSARMWA